MNKNTIAKIIDFAIAVTVSDLIAKLILCIYTNEKIVAIIFFILVIVIMLIFQKISLGRKIMKIK